MGLYQLGSLSDEQIGDIVFTELADAIGTDVAHAERERILKAGQDGRREVDRVLQQIAAEHDVHIGFEEKGHR